jgi:ABC-type dipeptide/oligopeptide/nickel transport system ATPase component
MRILAIAGASGVGKSTCMINLMECGVRNNPPTRMKEDLLEYEILHSGVVVLGRYDEGQLFSGTDRLSMGVQQDAEKFITFEHENTYPARPIAFEGDRLCASKFLNHCRSITSELRIVILIVKSELLAERRAERSFLAGKEQDANRKN